MNIITKTIKFDAAHRVALTNSKCRSIHGHLFTITAEMTGDLFTSGPQTEMVLDYSILKKLLMDNVDATCDHGLILSAKDDKFMHVAYDDTQHTSTYEDWEKQVNNHIRAHSYWAGTTVFGKTYIIGGYPTAEGLAQHFFKILAPKILAATNGQAKLTAITFNETATSSATYRPNYD